MENLQIVKSISIAVLLAYNVGAFAQHIANMTEEQRMDVQANMVPIIEDELMTFNNTDKQIDLLEKANMLLSQPANKELGKLALKIIRDGRVTNYIAEDIIKALMDTGNFLIMADGNIDYSNSQKFAQVYYRLVLELIIEVLASDPEVGIPQIEDLTRLLISVGR